MNVGSVTTANFQGWLLPPLGANRPASSTRRISGSGTGSFL